ncbi:MAG: methyltransferase domain-containing protein [Patescibacteria group bacterium]
MDLIVFLKKTALKFPKPIRVFLKKPWRMFFDRVKWDREMIRLMADYFKIPEKEVNFLLKNGEKLDAFFWNYLELKNSRELFYKNTPFYIFELAFWHMKIYQKIFRSKILDLSHGRVLDFGGGIGDLSLALANKGYQVDYADVNGETLNFAKYLFSKSESNIKIIDLSKEKIKENYDTIICIDVIEHLNNQQETLGILSKHLNQNGRLIITALDLNITNQEQQRRHPMHIPFDFDAKKYLLDNGLIETKYPFLFVKISN